MKINKLILIFFISLVPLLSVNGAEYRLGLSMHDVERRIEGGAAISIEKIFDRPAWWHPFAGRPHIGLSLIHI